MLLLKNATEEKVRKLVEKNFKKMRFSLKHSNRLLLQEKCLETIESDWGVKSTKVNDMVATHVNRLIPKEMD